MPHFVLTSNDLPPLCHSTNMLLCCLWVYYYLQEAFSGLGRLHSIPIFWSCGPILALFGLLQRVHVSQTLMRTTINLLHTCLILSHGCLNHGYHPWNGLKQAVIIAVNGSEQHFWGAHSAPKFQNFARTLIVKLFLKRISKSLY